MRSVALLAAIWMPGDTRTPAWVAWLSGGRYIGWALLPAEVDRIQRDQTAVFRLRAGVLRSPAEPATRRASTRAFPGGRNR